MESQLAPNEDPLGLKELAVSYDYLIYKINDYIKNLSDQTYDAVTAKLSLICNDYLNDQLQLDKELNDVDLLLEECNAMEIEFLKVKQLSMFINDFKLRLANLENSFN